MQLVPRAWDVESLLSYKRKESCGSRGEEKRAVKADREHRLHTENWGGKDRDCTSSVLTFLQKLTSSLDCIHKYLKELLKTAVKNKTSIRGGEIWLLI